MKRWSLLSLAALLLALAAPAPAAAQAEGTWFTVFADHVEIHNQQAFEENSRKFIKLFSDAGIEGIEWVTIQGAEMGYVYTIPGMGPGDMDDMNAGWGAALATLGQPVYDLMAENDALVESRDMWYLMLRPDLSYMPDAVAITAEMPYRYYTWLYVRPGQEAAFEATIPAWTAAYEDAGVDRGWRIYSIMTGQDLPAYLVVSSAESESAHFMADAEVQEMMGEKLSELRAATGATLRRVEENSGWVRPDLSYSAN